MISIVLRKKLKDASLTEHRWADERAAKGASARMSNIRFVFRILCLIGFALGCGFVAGDLGAQGQGPRAN